MSSSQTNNYCPAVITVVVASANSAYSAGTITVQTRGYGHKIGNSFTIQGTFLGGASPANDLTVSVLTLNSYGGIATLATAIGTSGPSSVGSYRLTLDFNNTYRFERDSSDFTRSLRERLIYNEKRPGTTIIPGGASPITGRPQVTPAGVNHLPAGNAELLWQQQGNNFRLAYLFGKLKCGAGFGGAFNLNGPNSFNSAGKQSGS
jgi:hypothetical protein